MLIFWAIAFTIKAVQGKYVNIESQSFVDYAYRTDNFFSISLRNNDGSIDPMTGVKVSFEIKASGYFEADMKGKWKYYTANGYVNDVLIHQNCAMTYNILIRAFGYESATSNDFIKSYNLCWHSLSILSISSVHIFETFSLATQFIQHDSAFAKGFPLYLEEFGDSFINGITSIASSAGNDNFIISFSSSGTKYIYAVYDDNNASVSMIDVLYYTIEAVSSLESVGNIYKETIFKLFSIQFHIKDKNNQVCTSCSGTVELFTSPTTIVNGNSQTIVTGQVTNGVVDFTNLSITSIGIYSIVVYSALIKNEVTIATVTFENPNLEILFIETPVDITSLFTVKVKIWSTDFSELITSVAFDVNIILMPSNFLTGNCLMESTGGECDFSNNISRKNCFKLA